VFLPSSGRRDALISGYVSRLDAQFSSQYYHVLQPFLLGQMDVNAAASQIQGLMSAAATRVLAAAH
jgi:hypothetical protein